MLAARARLQRQALRVLSRSAHLRHRRHLSALVPHASSRDVRVLVTAYENLHRKYVYPAFPYTRSLHSALLAADQHQKDAEKQKEEAESAQPSEGARAADGTKPESATDGEAKPDGAAGGAASGGKDEAKKEGSEKSAKPEPDDDQGNSWMGQAALALFVMLGLSLLGSRDHGREISFQAFVWDLLEPGLVDRIEVVNRNVARV